MAAPGYVSVRIGEELDKLVHDHCMQHDMQISQVVRAALREFFKISIPDAKEVVWKKIVGQP